MNLRGTGEDDRVDLLWLAPWDYAHDCEMVDVREPPEECGLEIAVTIARNYAADVTGEDPDPSAVGQAYLTAWSQ